MSPARWVGKPSAGKGIWEGGREPGPPALLKIPREPVPPSWHPRQGTGLCKGQEEVGGKGGQGYQLVITSCDRSGTHHTPSALLGVLRLLQRNSRCPKYYDSLFTDRETEV